MRPGRHREAGCNIITPTLTTPRLTLRPFTEADAEPLHRILNEDGILRYFPRPEPPDLARVQRLIAGQLRHWEEHGLGWWAVELRSTSDLRATGELLGWNGLQYLPDTEEVEVGYLLSRRHWGQGLATEGAQAALRFGVETLRLGSIIGVVHPENIASQRVLAKAGLTFINEADYFGMHVCRYVTTADRHGAYTISTDPGKLDAGFIQDFLANSSYWAQNRSLAVTEKALANSLCFGVYRRHGAGGPGARGDGLCHVRLGVRRLHRGGAPRARAGQVAHRTRRDAP